jgi:hypothetical protein
MTDLTRFLVGSVGFCFLIVLPLLFYLRSRINKKATGDRLPISWVTSMRIFRGQPAQSCHQGCKPRPVFLAHSCELHSHTATRSHVSHGGVGTDQAKD